VRVILAFLIATTCSALAWSQAPSAKSSDPSWQAFLPQFEEALNRFVNGDATLLKQLASHSADATIVGAWGAYERAGTRSVRGTTGPRPDLPKVEPS
jgi:hypothetical protein